MGKYDKTKHKTEALINFISKIVNSIILCNNSLFNIVNLYI